MSDVPRPVGDSLERLLGNLNAPSVDVLDVIFRSWESVVGPDLAAHTNPVAINGDQLSVRASDGVWAAEFRWLEPEVISRLAEVTGSDRIQRINVTLSRSS
ncbi:MAG: DUF721 domain-containing protein [Actinomycetota bacterium]